VGTCGGRQNWHVGGNDGLKFGGVGPKKFGWREPIFLAYMHDKENKLIWDLNYKIIHKHYISFNYFIIYFKQIYML
jgi:hypothetical protein